VEPRWFVLISDNGLMLLVTITPLILEVCICLLRCRGKEKLVQFSRIKLFGNHLGCSFLFSFSSALLCFVLYR
jgi:hypothetical protein